MKENIFIEIDAIKSYILGFIYADGHVCKNGNEISIMIGEKDFENIKDIIIKTGKWSIKKRIRLLKQTNKKYVSGCFRYHSKQTNLFLTKNDYREKSYLSPFKILNKIPKELHNNFFRGYIDGDGSFSFYGKKSCKFNICSSIGQDWSCMVDLLKKLHIDVYKVYKYKRKNGNSSLLSISNKWDIIKLGEYLYKDSEEIRLERKYEKYLEIKNSNINKRMPKWSKEECGFLLENYKNKGIDYCVKKLNRSKSAIRYKKYELNRKLKIKKHV